MALGMTIPFGLRDVKVKSFTDLTATVLAGTVDFPVARTLSFAETEEFEELRGDDRLAASHGSGPQVDWELEGGGISFEAVKAMFGGSIIESGITPNQVKTMRKIVTDQRPYFLAEGQAISDNGGDLHALIYKCKASGSLSGEFGDGQFFLTGASGVGMASTVPATVDRIYDWVQNETITPIV